MTRLDDLLARVPAELRDDLAEEIDRRARPQRHFGLVFERHQPEAVELTGMAPAQGDTAHVLPARGSDEKPDLTLWRVSSVANDGTVHLTEILPGGVEWDSEVQGREPRSTTANRDDVVPVAESTDTMYPGLELVDEVRRGDTEDPVHTIINGENLHALEALTYTHAGAIDCIYIDPPYNTGAKDWKYNNDYVDSNDGYRHSKWLTFMERRLLVAKRLLNPEDSVLIVTIDEKEVHRLALLLEQTFPGARIQMVSSVINRTGVARKSQFGRSDEYLFFVQLGASGPEPTPLESEWYPTNRVPYGGKLHWDSLMRTGTNRLRIDSPGAYYPIFVRQDEDGNAVIDSIGDSLPLGQSKDSVAVPTPLAAVWPEGTDGREGCWQTTPANARTLLEQGYLRPGKWRGERTSMGYLAAGNRRRVEEGYFDLETGEPLKPVEGLPTSQWNIVSHDAARGGSGVIRALHGEKRFTYPKSLYAVEDVLRFFVKDKPNATVLDFFAGSGTTAHAVMRLNQEDGGKRRSISVTNNEVSADEAKALTKRGLRPGDAEWDELGIAQHVTFPRVKAAVTGRTAKSGYTAPIKGKYGYNREASMAEGIPANAALFKLTYENPTLVEYDMAFDRIAPLLWLRAGQTGRVIDSSAVAGGWAVGGTYAVLVDTMYSRQFVAEVRRNRVPLVYVVTDSDSMYQTVARQVPQDTEVVRLYTSYLTNFRINTGYSAG